MTAKKITTKFSSEDTLKELATIFALVKTGVFFDAEGNEEVSNAMREVQEFLNMTVSARDNLADEVGVPRLVGKRGRKGKTAMEMTPEEILADFKRSRK